MFAFYIKYSFDCSFYNYENNYIEHIEIGLQLEILFKSPFCSYKIIVRVFLIYSISVHHTIPLTKIKQKDHTKHKKVFSLYKVTKENCWKYLMCHVLILNLSFCIFLLSHKLLFYVLGYRILISCKIRTLTFWLKYFFLDIMMQFLKNLYYKVSGKNGEWIVTQS